MLFLLKDTEEEGKIAVEEKAVEEIHMVADYDAPPVFLLGWFAAKFDLHAEAGDEGSGQGPRPSIPISQVHEQRQHEGAHEHGDEDCSAADPCHAGSHGFERIRDPIKSPSPFAVTVRNVRFHLLSLFRWR